MILVNLKSLLTLALIARSLLVAAAREGTALSVERELLIADAGVPICLEAVHAGALLLFTDLLVVSACLNTGLPVELYDGLARATIVASVKTREALALIVTILALILAA